MSRERRLPGHTRARVVLLDLVFDVEATRVIERDFAVGTGRELEVARRAVAVQVARGEERVDRLARVLAAAGAGRREAVAVVHVVGDREAERLRVRGRSVALLV